MIFFYLLVGVMPLSQHRIWGRTVGDMTVFKYLGAVCLLYAVFYLGLRRKLPPFFHTWQARLFALFYLIATASYFTHRVGARWETSPFVSYTSFFLLFFVTLTVVDSLRRLRIVLLIAIGSFAYASLYVVREWQKYHSLYEGFRPGWVVGDPNYFTASALLILPLAFYLMLERRPGWERLFCLGSLIVILLGLTLAASRGGFLGLVAALLFFVLNSRQRARNLALVALLVLPLSLISPASPVARLLHPGGTETEAQQNRLVAWKAGLRMIQAHPLVGIGLGNFKPLMAVYADPDVKVESVAHNVYIEIAAEMGIPALLVFAGIMYFSYRTASQVRRRLVRSGPPLLQQTALGFQAGLLGFAVACLFVSAEYQKLYWLMVFLSVCMAPLVWSQPTTASSDLVGDPSGSRADAAAGNYVVQPLPGQS